MKMKNYSLLTAFVFLLTISFSFTNIFAQHKEERVIEMPDIPGYKTMICDFHMHTVLSDGEVWPSIRVQEAVKDGLNAISITDHIEYQPHTADIPHPDRNRSFELATQAAKGKDLIIINGTEITRSMPPGHCNAIFIKDVNKLNTDDVMQVFWEAKQQGAFVFWNHPHWTAQKPDGIAELTDLHKQLIKEGLIDGIEIVNDLTYSDEAFQIALDNNLTIMGTSDVHGLVDWQYHVSEGGHRPVTLVFAKEKTEEAIKEGLENRRTAVWNNNSLFGDAQFLVPLIKESLIVKKVEAFTRGENELPVKTITFYNPSDIDFILENNSEYTLHDNAKVFTIEAHKSAEIQVKTREVKQEFELKFKVLNAYTSPKENPEITIQIK